MRRIRIRTMMMLVAVLALLLGSMGPGRRTYHRWWFYRSQAAVYGRLEQSERLRASRELILSANSEAVRKRLMNSPEFLSKPSEQQRAIIDAQVMYHRFQSEEARLAAKRWAENQRDCETAALWCWDPYAPDVP